MFFLRSFIGKYCFERKNWIVSKPKRWYFLSARKKCPLRSSHRRCSIKKGVLKNFANITGKHLCSISFDRSSHWRCSVEKVFFKFFQISQENTSVVVSLIKFFKKRLQHRCFPVKFSKFLRTHISKNIYEQLLLSIDLFPKGCIFCENLLYCIRLG